MASVRSIVFVCLHGAAKSVIAATYLNQLSTARGLNILATAAGIEPESDVPPQVCEGLLHEGLDVRHYRPRAVTPEELAAAWRAVSSGCDLSDVAPPSLAMERWDDVPQVSDGSQAARDRESQAALARQAKVTADQARSAALAAVAGTVPGVRPDREGSAVVYEVRILPQSGSASQDVTVDATSGKLLKTEPARERERDGDD